MIIVHHLNNSRSQRVLWLLEELRLEYTVKRYERDAGTRLAPPELKAIHPLGKSPVVEHDGHRIAETGAIVDYLLDLVPGTALRPAPGTAEARRMSYWLHYAEGSAMPPLVMKLIFNEMPKRVPTLIRPVAKAISKGMGQGYLDPQIASHVAYWQAELTATGWFAGSQFSAADIMMSFPLEAARSRAGLDASRPHTIAWLDKVHARPAYQTALAKGGPYAYA